MLSFSDFLAHSRFPASYNQTWFADAERYISEFELMPITGRNLWQALSNVSTNVIAAYNVITSYSIGQTVLYQSVYYRSLTNGNVGNVPSISSAYWTVNDTQTLYSNYVQMFMANATAHLLVTDHGIQITPFALSIAGATSGDAADSKERGITLTMLQRKKENYAAQIKQTLINKSYKLDGVSYDQIVTRNNNRSGFFTI
jgi:hypothetical protein